MKKGKDKDKKEELSKVVKNKSEVIDFYLKNKKELGFKKPSDMLKWYYK